MHKRKLRRDFLVPIDALIGYSPLIDQGFIATEDGDELATQTNDNLITEGFPVNPGYLATQDDNFLATESGNNLITES